MSDEDHPKGKLSRPPPALFATIHHRSERRPNGYTAEDIYRLNQIAKGAGWQPPEPKTSEDA